MEVRLWGPPASPALSEDHVPNLDPCLLMTSAGSKTSESRKGGAGKEGKIVFQFLSPLPCRSVTLQLAEDKAVGPVFVPVPVLSAFCGFSSVALLRRAVCCYSQDYFPCALLLALIRTRSHCTGLCADICKRRFRTGSVENLC